MAGDSSTPLPAARHSWINHPLPEQRSALALRREFTHVEYESVRRGLVPEAMEDKWFIFLEGDTLYFHRSWTGHCIFQLTLEREGENYSVSEVLVNRDPSQYSGGGEGYDVKLLTFLIDNLLLGKVSTFPMPAGVPAGVAAGLYQHHVAGTGPGAGAAGEGASILGWVWAWLRGIVRGLAREWRRS